MKFSLDRLLAAFGNIRAMERLHVDDHAEAIIDDINDIPYAISKENVMYAHISELGGYHFMQTIVLGSFHVKTFKGATLLCNGVASEFVLKSDMMELESEHSNVSNRSMTRIDFQIDEDVIPKMEKVRIEKLILTCKKQVLEFEIHQEDSTNLPLHS